MIKTLFSAFGDLFKSEEQASALQTPQETAVTFILSHRSTSIGELTLNNGTWTFQYTEEFKHQNKLTPIIDFSDVNKVYISAELFPYFSFRIPSVTRPQIKQVIEKEKIDSNNTVELLKHFGQRTIVNPFHLQMA